ncbi:MAG: thiol peroxidase [Campylobacterales bacterium]
MAQQTKLKGNPVNLTGNALNAGDAAAAVTVVKGDLSEMTVGGAKDQAQLIVVVPSLDTAVCATETRNFNTKAAALEGVETTIVSMDLPFASKRFCSTEGIENVTTVSDFRNKEFGKAYGVLIADGPLAGVLARAIFVVNKAGKITYKELVPEITAEPEYEKALEAAKAAAK